MHNASSSILLNGTVNLDAQGDPNAVFVIQIASTLTTGSLSNVNLINGAQACNIFWQIGTSATIGDNSTFQGNILADTAITLNSGATVNGRLFAMNAAITLAGNVIDIPTCRGNITVIKNVINDNNGTMQVEDFPLFVNGAPVLSSEVNSFPTPNTYTITETSNISYSSSFSGDCDVNGEIILNDGDDLICTITNDDIAPIPPEINVTKISDPLSLPVGPGLVEYTYTLENIGTVNVTNITMEDDVCSPVTYVSGDTNLNSELEVSETWTYSCSMTLNITTTNIITATGFANGLSDVDTDSVTVVVTPIEDPPVSIPVSVPLSSPTSGGLSYTGMVNTSIILVTTIGAYIAILALIYDIKRKTN